MDGLYDRQARFHLVVAYMDENPDGLDAIIGVLEARLRLVVANAVNRLTLQSNEWPGVLDLVTLLCQERVRLESTRMVLLDDVVQERLPRLRSAWMGVSHELTSHEMEKILRDPAAPNESPQVRAVREAWLPVSLAGEAVLAVMNAAPPH